jgi:hypothetical protein
MTQVATAAADTLPEDLRVDETHQPAEQGFIVFAEPIGSYLGDALGDRRVDIAAASWGPLPGVPEAMGVTFYSVRDLDYVRHSLTRILGRPPKRDELDAALKATPEWLWDNEMTLHHGNAIADLDLIGELSTLLVGQAVVPWLKVLYAAWLLMTQPGISQIEQVTLNRRLQRREAREGVRTSEVRIVHVHRRHRDKPTGNQPCGSGERRYTVRWLVRGHWRNKPTAPTGPCAAWSGSTPRSEARRTSHSGPARPFTSGTDPRTGNTRSSHHTLEGTASCQVPLLLLHQRTRPWSC